MVSAVIVAAGSSRRMGFDKLYAPLAEKPVLYWSLAAFDACKEIDEIIVVTREDKIEEVERLVKSGGLSKVGKIVPGGAERHLSVWTGLKVITGENSEFVGVHDGARPLVTPELISGCLALAQKDGAAVCATPIPDTVKRAEDSVITESVDRQNLWAMQTPQFFSTPLILQAYAALMTRNEVVTDEVSAVQRLGKRVTLFQTEEHNFKITYPRDLALAEQILASRPGGAGLPSRKA